MQQCDVVTGGAGFIGSHLSAALLGLGRQVRVVDNFSTGRQENLAHLLEEFPDRCQVHRLDVCETRRLEALFAGCQVVYHQAAMTSVQLSMEDPLLCNRNNIEGTLSVLEAARRARVARVVLASSTAVYGDSPELPKRETMPPRPISPYAVSKYVGELYARIYSEAYRLPVAALRYFNVFGPRQDPTSDYAAVIPRFIDRMLERKPPIVYGDGEQSRDFVFVEDVVAANLLAGRPGAPTSVFNVASGSSLTLNVLIEHLNRILGTRLEACYQAARAGDVRHSSADISRARAQLGYRPAVSLAEGLEKTVGWFDRERTSP